MRTAPLALALLVSSCGGRASELLPAAPTALRTTVLRAFVVDTAFRALPGARVEVLTGDSAGVVAVADDTGAWILRGTFTASTLFRATADDHDPRTQPWNCSVATCGDGGANPWLGFYLAPQVPPVDITGDYTLTILADGACVDIPPALRERRYRASVSAQPPGGRPAVAAFDLTVTDDSMVGLYRGFTIGVAGSDLGFAMHGGHDPVLVERIEGRESISVSGFAATSVAGSRPSVITAALDGWIEYISPLGAKFNCTSTAHQIILRRL